jgi:hypothetical protein
MEKDSSVNTTITTFIYWLGLSLGILSFLLGLIFPFVIENRILSAILLCVGAAISLRFCFGSVSLTEFIAACAAGLVVGAGFGVFPASQPTALEIVFGILRYVLAIMLLWFAFQIKSEKNKIWLNRLNIGLVSFGITFFLAIHPLWLNIQLWLNARVNAESITGNIFSSKFLWFHISNFAMWLRELPLYVFFVSFALYLGSRSDNQQIKFKILGTSSIIAGLLFGLFVVILENNFDLRQQFAAVFYRHGYSLEFVSVDAAPTEAQMEDCVKIIRMRLDEKAKGWASVSKEGDQKISVGIDERWGFSLNDEFIRSACQERGILEFRFLAQKNKSDWSDVKDSELINSEESAEYVNELVANGPLAGATKAYRWFELANDDVIKVPYYVMESYAGKKYVLAFNTDGKCMLWDGSWKLENVSVGVDQIGKRCIEITFSDEGGRKMGGLTGRNIGRALAILVDNKVYSAPIVQSAIYSRAQITGLFTLQEVEELVNKLSFKPLPVALKFADKRK